MDTTRYTNTHWYNSLRGDEADAGATTTAPVAAQEDTNNNNNNNNEEESDELALSNYILPDLHGKSDILTPMHIRELSTFMPARAEGYAWTLAFTTTTMGFSLKSLYRSLSRYEGPVLLIIQDNENVVFGAFSSCSLNPSESFYGTGETYLFTFKQSAQQKSSIQQAQLVSSPAISLAASSESKSTIEINQDTTNIKNVAASAGQFKRFPWTGDNLYFIKGNSDSLAFGAGEGNFGLWLDEDLYHGSTHSCKTFNNEPLTNREDFFVCTLECWCFL